MVAQAQAELPNECCGLLAGKVVEGRGVAEICYPLVNSAASPVEYLSSPESMFRAFKDLNERGLDVLAIYHSHPTSAPIPSRTDLARNWSPEVVNLIISLQGREVEMRGWWLTDTDYREAEWVVLDRESEPSGTE
jgi:proteasome lid subunit RPN8/RPN11